jgi:hypothetical protein
VVCWSQSQWSSGLRRGSAADCLLGLQVRISSSVWILVLWLVAASTPVIWQLSCIVKYAFKFGVKMKAGKLALLSGAHRTLRQLRFYFIHWLSFLLVLRIFLLVLILAFLISIHSLQIQNLYPFLATYCFNVTPSFILVYSRFPLPLSSFSSVSPLPICFFLYAIHLSLLYLTSSSTFNLQNTDVNCLKYLLVKQYWETICVAEPKKRLVTLLTTSFNPEFYVQSTFRRSKSL